MNTMKLIAPPGYAKFPIEFSGIEFDQNRCRDLITAMQRFREQIYLEDGAITEEEALDEKRLHVDQCSWHLLLLENDDTVCGCMRFTINSSATSFDQLFGISRSWLAHSGEWGFKLRSAVEQRLRACEQLGVPHVEVGGWAIAKKYRFSPEPSRTVLGGFALLRLLGGCLGIATATTRNGSASILRRIGCSPLQHESGEFPPYWDPQYRCKMEVLCFDATRPVPRYAARIAILQQVLCRTTVYAAAERSIAQATAVS
jgi:hypothetical protein